MNNHYIDDLLKLSSLQEVEIPEKINKTIDDTLKKCKNKKSSFSYYLRKIIAIILAGLSVAASGIVVYAGVTGKLNINIGNTGHQKIDKNYNEVATAVNKSFDNEYLTITLESMAVDPAYLIFEYDIKLKDKAIQEIGGEVPFTEHEGYNISLNSNTFINGKEKILSGGRNLTSTEKITDKKFRFVEIFSIADIKGTELSVEKKIKSLIIYSNEPYYHISLNADISQILTANVKFENREPKILAEQELSNGSMLYIEEVTNSKFENFVLARIVSQTKKYDEIFNKEKEFMIEDPQFAICNQNDEIINYDFNRLDDYFEVLQSNGNYSVQEQIDGENQVRHQSVLLLKLAIEEKNVPETIKILPVSRKLYNDRNKSEYEFYQNEEWYPVKIGETNISETSQIGGNVTITKIEETENELIFYYDAEGYVPCIIDFVLRVKNARMNYWYPRYEEFKGINSDKNKIIYSKDTSLTAGLPLTNYNRLDNLDELEFAIFYNTKYDVLSEPLSFEWKMAENNEVATIDDIHFTEFIETINDNLQGYAEMPEYKGKIVEITDKYLKFQSDITKRIYALENPKSFEYINKRTGEILDFSNIKVNDYFSYDYWGDNFDIGQFLIIRELKGEELKKELLAQMRQSVPMYNVNFIYREVKNIEIKNDKEAIITYEFSDMYQYLLGNDEKFEIKVKVDENTVIYRGTAWIDEEYFLIHDLETAEYVPSRVNIYLDQSTINNEIPVAVNVDLGWLDEEF